MVKTLLTVKINLKKLGKQSISLILRIKKAAWLGRFNQNLCKRF